jgi:hypothetical protein
VSYQVQSSDTSLEAEQVQIQLMRRFGTVRRFALLANLSNSTRRMAWQNFRRTRAELGLRQKQLLFLELLYGKALLQELQTALKVEKNFTVDLKVSQLRRRGRRIWKH